MTKQGIYELKAELARLESWQLEPRILALRREIMKEREPRMAAIRAQIDGKRANLPQKKQRIPEGCPQEVIDLCYQHWKGTTELTTHRIHMWNDKAIWTSYPNSVYFTNGGANKAQACFLLISRTEKASGMNAGCSKVLAIHEGRFAPSLMKQILEEKTR